MSVESQRLDINSMLNWTERSIRLRKECPELGWGDCAVMHAGQASVLGIRYDWRNNSLVILHNFHEKPSSMVLEVEGERGGTRTNLLPGESSQAMSNGKHKMVLGGDGYRGYRVGRPEPYSEAEEILKLWHRTC